MRNTFVHVSDAVLLGYALFVSVATSAIVYGFSAIQPVLVDVGAFSSDCVGGAVSGGQAGVPVEACEAQTSALATLYTVAATVLNCAVLPGGILLDAFGTRIMVCGALLVLAYGCVLIAVAPDAYDWFYIVGFGLISTGGYNAWVALVPLSVRFRRRSLIVSLFGGANPASAVALFAIAALASRVSFRFAWLAYAVLCVALAVLGALILPASIGDDDAVHGALGGDADETIALLNAPERGIQGGSDDKRAQRRLALRNAPVGKQLRSWQALGNLCYSIVIVLTANTYIGGAPDQLRTNSEATDTAGMLNVLNLVIALVGGAFSLIFGLLLSRVGPAWTALIVAAISVAAAVLGALTAALPIDAQYVTFVLVALSVPGLVSFASDFIEATFGVEHFGTMFGFTAGLVGVFGLLQLVFVQWAAADGNAVGANYDTVLWCLAALCAASSIFPIALFLFH